MNNIECKVDVEPKDDYGKAKKLLYETDIAIGNLPPQDRDNLLAEYLQYKGMFGLIQEIQQYLSR